MKRTDQCESALVDEFGLATIAMFPAGRVLHFAGALVSLQCLRTSTRWHSLVVAHLHEKETPSEKRKEMREFVRLLAEEARVDADPMFAWEMFKNACENGFSEIAQRVAEIRRMTSDDVRSHQNISLQLACEFGHLKTVQWLVDRFDFTEADARAMDNFALRRTCAAGHLSLAQWLVT